MHAEISYLIIIIITYVYIVERVKIQQVSSTVV